MYLYCVRFSMFVLRLWISISMPHRVVYWVFMSYLWRNGAKQHIVVSYIWEGERYSRYHGIQWLLTYRGWEGWRKSYGRFQKVCVSRSIMWWDNQVVVCLRNINLSVNQEEILYLRRMQRCTWRTHHLTGRLTCMFIVRVNLVTSSLL